MKQLTILAFAIGIFLTTSCSKKCITCENGRDVIQEFCEDSDTTYTDPDGNPVSFDMIEETFESLGFDCD